MNYVLKTTGILLTMATIPDGYQGSSEKYTFRDIGIEQLNAGSYGGAIQFLDDALEESDGLVGISEVDVLKRRVEAEYKAEDYAIVTYIYEILSQVDEARPGYVDRQNMSYTKAGGLDKVMEAYQAAYGPDAEKNEVDGKGGGDSADSKDGKNGRRDADKEDGTDGGNADNGAGSAGGEDAAAVSGQVTVLLPLGQALMGTERFDDAKALHQQVIDDGIRGDELYNRMGLCEMGAGGLDMAPSCLGAGMRLPDEGARQRILYDRAAVYEQKQDFATAPELLETYVATYGSTPEVGREIIFLKGRQQ